MNNATLNRFFSLHFLLPFVLAALAVAHMISLHVHGSSNPNGISNNGDRIPMHPYFTFKDLITIFAFFGVLSVMVFYYPNVLGQKWPYIMLLIVYIIFICAISWKYILNKYLVKIYNKTILVSDLLINKIMLKFIELVINYGYFIFKLNPNIVKYYYKIYNQQITKVIIYINHCAFDNYICENVYFNVFFKAGISLLEFIKHRFNYCELIFKLLQVGISETICTHKKIIKRKLSFLGLYYSQKNTIIKDQEKRKMSTSSTKFKSSNLIQNESIKDGHNKEISLKFRQWFAGLTDGDGYIYVNKEGCVGFELTLPTCDEKVLRIIQNKFGGNIKARAGVKAVRYRTQNRETVTKIINCLNGLVINNIRLAQLHKACLTLNIPIKTPVYPTIDSAYLSGLLDSDGTINIYKHFYNNTFRYQLTISIANKSRCNVEFLLNVIGGDIYFDKSQNGCYYWKANSKFLHLKLYDYFVKFPPKTIKAHRTYLIKEFHELNEFKAYRCTDKLSMNFKKWKRFITKWDNKN